jgi:hypothetical protein
MKPSTKANILLLAGSILMLAGVLAKPLGVPSEFDGFPALAAIGFIYWGYRLSTKAKAGD